MSPTGSSQDRAAGLLASLALVSAGPEGRWGDAAELALDLLSPAAPDAASLRHRTGRVDPGDVIGAVATAAALVRLADTLRETTEFASRTASALTDDGDVVAASADWSAVLRQAVLSGEVPELSDSGGSAGPGWEAGSAVARGAARGWSAIPFPARRDLAGPDGRDADALMRAAVAAALGSDPGSGAWPLGPRFDYGSWSGTSAFAVHPEDQGVLLGGVDLLRHGTVDAVVSLCRLGTEERPASVAARDHASFWLVDTDDPAQNPHLRAVLEDAARAVQLFRSEGKRVLLHCVQAQSRTPTVAALYSSLVTGEPAWKELLKVKQMLPAAHVNAAFERELRLSALPAA